MIRFILWLLILFMLFRIIRIVLNVKQHPDSNHINIDIPEPQPPHFDNIQDAEFEDLTPKPPPAPPSS